MKANIILKFLFFLAIGSLVYVLYTFTNKAAIYKINIIKKESNNLIDDFSNNLQKNHWNILEEGSVSNHELEYYHANNVKLENNAIQIIAKKENFMGYQYTSGFITTKNKFSFLYGKVIFRAKAAVGKGLLSAVWMLPEDGTLLPEIDVMEILGASPQKVWTSMHFLNNNVKDKRFNEYNSPNKDYALYELDWKENELSWYVDNKLVYKVTDNVPNKKMYLNINLSVGGDWPGNPLDNIFPSTFNIDYVIVIPEGEEK